jgi:hypothetical protein
VNESYFLCSKCIVKLGAGPGGHGRHPEMERAVYCVFFVARKYAFMIARLRCFSTHFETRVNFTEDGALDWSCRLA